MDELTPEERLELQELEELDRLEKLEAEGKLDQPVLSATDQAMKKTNTLLQRGIQGVGEASRAVDKYTMGPIRESIGRLQSGQSFMDPYDYEKVPSWSDIAGKAGVSEEKNIPSPVIINPWDPQENKLSAADIAGGAVGAVADPLNFVPLGTMGKGARIAGRAAEKIGAPLVNVAKKAKDFAEERAAKAAVGSGKQKMNALAGITSKGIPDKELALSKVRQAGRTMLDDKQIGWLSDTEAIGDRASKEFKNLQNEFAAVEKIADEAIPSGAVSGLSIRDKILDYAANLPENERGKKLQARLLREAKNFENKPKLTFAEAQKFKDSYKFNPQSGDAFVSDADINSDIKAIIGSEMENAIEQTSSALKKTNPQAANKLALYKDLKKKYGPYKNVARAATSEEMSDLSRRFVSPSDIYAGGTLGTASAVLTQDPTLTGAFGLIGLVANNQMRKRGSAFAARSADKIAKTIGTKPETFNKWGDRLYRAATLGNSSLVIQHNLLMNSDQEYRRLFESSGTESPEDLDQ